MMANGSPVPREYGMCVGLHIILPWVYSPLLLLFSRRKAGAGGWITSTAAGGEVRGRLVFGTYWCWSRVGLGRFRSWLVGMAIVIGVNVEWCRVGSDRHCGGLVVNVITLGWLVLG